MGWETRRNGRRYYYRSRRENGRVIREYVGGGERGRLAAEADAAARRAAATARRSHREIEQPIEELEIQLAEVAKLVDITVTCELLVAGWNCHHRQWRSKAHVGNNRRRK
jgi:hypothetical protein